MASSNRRFRKAMQLLRVLLGHIDYAFIWLRLVGGLVEVEWPALHAIHHTNRSLHRSNDTAVRIGREMTSFFHGSLLDFMGTNYSAAVTRLVMDHASKTCILDDLGFNESR